MLELDRTSSEPLGQQLFRQIRDELEAGSFGGGFWKLPSSRALAVDLQVSRLTIKRTYSKLRGEGYLRTWVGRGTFVADPLPGRYLVASREPVATTRKKKVRLSNRVETMRDRRTGRGLDAGAAGEPGEWLVPGIPAVDEFPLPIWERLRTQVLAQKGANLLRYASSRGDLALRKAISAYLCDFRGARCHADQVIIVSGTQQALVVTALALLDPGDNVWMEDPGFHQASKVFAFLGASLVPRPLDREGLTIDHSASAAAPRLIYVTPSHQFPLGMTMSLRRRKSLIAFAQLRDAFIFEDDYNSEFRFNGPPLACLQGLDHVDRVIYAGTMSKILYPSLRLGYLVVPPALVEPMIKTRAALDQHSPTIDQSTLALFITEGYFLSHVKRMRTLYAERRQYFADQFQKLLGDYFSLQVPKAGLHCVAWLRRVADYDRIRRSWQREGKVSPVPLSVFALAPLPKPAFVFGFAAWTPTQILESLQNLAARLKTDSD